MDTEMDKRSEQDSAAREQEGEEETSFTDNDQRRDESILTPEGSNPYFETVGGEDTESRYNPLKESSREETEQFLREVFKTYTDANDGPYSTTLYDRFLVVRNDNNEIGGANYRGGR